MNRLTGDSRGFPVGEDGPAWLGYAETALNVTIGLLNLAVARSVYRAYRRDGSGRRYLALVLALLALCACSHGLTAFAPPASEAAPARYVPTALKAVAAAFWVVTAARLCSTRRATRPPSAEVGTANLSADGPGPGRAKDGPTARLIVKARDLSTLIHNDPWLLDKADALKELQDIIADLEALPCSN